MSFRTNEEEIVMSHKFNDADFDSFLDRLDDDSGYRFSNNRLDDFDFMLWYWMDSRSADYYLSDAEEVLKTAGKVTRAQRDFIKRQTLGCRYGRVGMSYATTRDALTYFLADTVPGLLCDFIRWKLHGQIDCFSNNYGHDRRHEVG